MTDLKKRLKTTAQAAPIADEFVERARREDSIDFGKISDAHRALLHGSRAKPKPLLADQAQSPASWIKLPSGKRAISTLVKQLHKYEKVVLDDDAVRLVCRTAHTEPKQIARMTELAVAPYDKLWVEMSYAAMDDEIRSLQPPLFPRTVHPDERIAFVFKNNVDSITVRIVQHVDGDPKHMHEWPVAYGISNNGEPLTVRRIGEENEFGVASDHMEFFQTEAMITNTSKDVQAGRLWGYDPRQTKVKPLRMRGQIVILPDFMEMYPNQSLWDVSQAAAKELSGIARRAVALLALMNTTIVEMRERTRPQGRFVGPGGSAKPYLERTTAVLNIPHRVRYVDDYVKKEIAHEISQIRKRRHHVKGHFRHLPYEPINGEGWVPCFCPGREPGRYWHRFIHDHERGDATLGYVDHDFTIVRGEHEE